MHNERTGQELIGDWIERGIPVYKERSGNQTAIIFYKYKKNTELFCILRFLNRSFYGFEIKYILH